MGILICGKKRCHFPAVHKFKIHSLPDVCSALVAMMTTSICRRMSRGHVFVVKIRRSVPYWRVVGGVERGRDIF